MSDNSSLLPMAPALLVPYVAVAADQVATGQPRSLDWALDDAERTLTAELAIMLDGEDFDAAPPVAALRSALGDGAQLSAITLQSLLPQQHEGDGSPAQERQLRIDLIAEVLEWIRATRRGSTSGAAKVSDIFSSAARRLVGGGSVDIF
ncbi:hypothetical protein [Kribbella sp. NPDC050459]|uniref:hypothetical protein n=1 Tax=Kribbella sp. NPDC050459 TaxID=3155785 RepID=UPI003410294A